MGGAASEKDGEAKNGETEEGAASDDKKEEGEKEEKKEEKKEKKKKTKMVQKEKKKKHVRTLEVSSYHTGDIRPYSPELMAESKAKLALLAKADEERVQLEESKNKFESYIYHIRNRLIDDEELMARVSTEEQRAALSKSAEDAEEWMFDDGYTADLATVEAKYDELSGPAIKVFFRAAELTARPKAVEALTDKLTKIEELMKKWETTRRRKRERKTRMPRRPRRRKRKRRRKKRKGKRRRKRTRRRRRTRKERRRTKVMRALHLRRTERQRMGRQRKARPAMIRKRRGKRKRKRKKRRRRRPRWCKRRRRRSTCAPSRCPPITLATFAPTALNSWRNPRPSLLCLLKLTRNACSLRSLRTNLSHTSTTFATGSLMTRNSSLRSQRRSSVRL